MAESPSTRPSLLLRIRDRQDREAWERFVEIYVPLVYGFARRHRLQDADAADLTQDVLRAVAGAAHRIEYDPERGSFRGWLFTIARNKLRNFVARRKRQPQASGDSREQRLIEDQPGREQDEAAAWDREYELRLFTWAAAEVRHSFEESSWQAFWGTAVEGRSPKEVAASLGISVGAVYIAKSRIIARLKKEIEQLEAQEDWP